MNDRLDVLKTYKLYIDGKFPRTESGRSMPLTDAGGELRAHACRASRKDLRDAVEAARRAQPGWARATAYLRGQILYRLGEMLESRRAEFEGLLGAGEKPARASKRRPVTPEAEVRASVDRLVTFAGWADKIGHVLGCANPVAGPYHTFSVPEATGVVAVITPERPALLGLVSLVAPVLCAGNTAVVIASGQGSLGAAVFGEVCATGDLPPGVINILTADRAELLPHVAGHRDIDAVHGAGVTPDDGATLRAGSAENLKRVVVRTLDERAWYDHGACGGPWWIEPFVEIKTVWHPASA